ncbi:peptide/nickel transport system substrate-binding protein [Streptomyces zagrosensis]|uniref:Peptide/nickel transport system substrate-binding protein n=1 Tax=Streptomyces zagrosensis TaxID=1042984 RepID=A0A7W9Q717_9ACTN|nr:ABC transporter substrate-binding protein [Streptomyces zagrosensis]MBB5934796.1 peptide/nickel transport system substrate-binding protein [Streptomyces zagrosensis]
MLSSSGDDDKPIMVGTADPVKTLDPAGAYDAGSWGLYSNIFQSLLTFTPAAPKPVPDAAKKCGFTSDELLTYVCELRSGLRFTSGRDITAQDVKFSFDRIVAIHDPGGPMPLLNSLKSVEAKGANKVVFHLSSADATFPYKIATGAGSIVDREKYSASKLRTGDDVVGSGPYVLKKYEHEKIAELRSNSRYKGALKDTGKPVTVRYFKDAEKLRDAWKKRNVDVAARQLPSAYLKSLSPSDSSVRVMNNPGATTGNLAFNVRTGSAMKNPAARRAIAAVVDRGELISIAHSRTVDSLYSLIPKGVTGHSTAFYDAYPKPSPDRARRILRDAGITTPVNFTMAYPSGSAAKAEGAELKAQLEETGLFKVTFNQYDWNTFQNGFNKGAYDAYGIIWYPDFLDADTFISPLVGAESTLHNGYSNAKVDGLIRDTQKSPQRERVVGDFREIQRIVAHDVPLLPLWQGKDTVVSKDSISGTQFLSEGTGMWRLWELDRI